MTKFLQGKFKPNHPEKYIGDINNIVWRSSWELKFLRWVDSNPSVLKYGSEEIIIPYLSPLDNKIHRYFVDFFIEVKQKSGNTKKFLVEVKPYKQTQPPQPKKQTKYALNEAATYIINKSKWESAKKFCEKHGWDFVIITEKELGIK